MADVAASVLAKLKNKAKAAGISYQQCLQLFMQEEFLRKLSKSGIEEIRTFLEPVFGAIVNEKNGYTNGTMI